MSVGTTGRSGPLKVALAGAGMISWFHLVGWRKVGSRVRLVAVCDPSLANARARADEFGIEHVFQDRDAMLEAVAIDALDVASPRETHADWVDAAVARGIDVLCQKPLTPEPGRGARPWCGASAGARAADGARELAVSSMVPDDCGAGSPTANSAMCCLPAWR